MFEVSHTDVCFYLFKNGPQSFEHENEPDT